MSISAPNHGPGLSFDALPEVIASLVAESIERDRVQPMRPYQEAQELSWQLPLELGEDALPWPETLTLVRRILAATPSTSSRRFFNQLFGGRDAVATVGEVAATLTNSPMHTFKASGVQVLLEREVLRRMGALVGFSDGDGMIAPGGSLSNLAATIMARNEALPGSRDGGRQGPPGTIYTSVASHYSVSKAAMMAGLGRGNVRRVPVDAKGRMRSEILSQMIEHDRAQGAVPVMINATAGTTVLGAFDPLPEVADVAERAKVWLHVDAAYGGSILLSPRYRHLLVGCDRADSVTWDAHKLLNVPLTCSALLTRRAGRCTQNFDEEASYLFQDESLVDPGRGSMQCGRHNDALKLWLMWKHYGDRGLAQRIDRLFALAAHLRARVQAHPRLRLRLPVASINVCFEVEGVSSRRLCRALWERNVASIGHAVVNECEVIRWVFVNPQVETTEVDAILEELIALAEELT